MLRISVDDLSPSVSGDVDRIPCRSTLSLSSLRIDGFSRKCSSYYKLPDFPYRLSVLKLDGSGFDIEVSRKATVAELKMAVENVFIHMPQKGPGKISWPHVWGHFCLSFDGQKLLAETSYIVDYGIRDGDQLHFIRHHSTTYNLRRKLSKKRVSASKQDYINMPLSPLNKEKTPPVLLSNSEDYDAMENGRYRHRDPKDEIIEGTKESRLIHFLRGWLSYSRLVTSERTRRKSKSFQSRHACNIMFNFKRIVKLCGGKRYARFDAPRED